MSEPKTVDEAIEAARRAAHHAYCKDTGCFDGDDIASPAVDAALRAIAYAAYEDAGCMVIWEDGRDCTFADISLDEACVRCLGKAKYAPEVTS